MANLDFWRIWKYIESGIANGVQTMPEPEIFGSCGCGAVELWSCGCGAVVMELWLWSCGVEFYGNGSVAVQVSLCRCMDMDRELHSDVQRSSCHLFPERPLGQGSPCVDLRGLGIRVVLDGVGTKLHSIFKWQILIFGGSGST